jgi:hypothetical protein
MSSYWPEIKDTATAKDAVLGAAAVSAFVAAITGLLAILSLIYKKPILGLDGLALVDAGLFALVAWRIYRMSRTWAVIGLLLYLLGAGWRLVNRPSAAVGVMTIIFILAFIGGIRGTFAFHKYQKEGRPAAGGGEPHIPGTTPLI